MNKAKQNLYQKLPLSPGVYLMRGTKGKILYVGKAGNLRRRVSSYFLRPLEKRLQDMIGKVKKIDYLKTGSAMEALVVEARLIKKYNPNYNIREKDNKSFLFAEFTKEKFPRVLLVRGSDPKNGQRFGPFTSAQSVRQALKILRRIFPFHNHLPEQVGKFERPCLDAQIGLCPGTCVDGVTKKDYFRNISALKMFFRGERRRLMGSLTKEMKAAAADEKFELAEKTKRQIFALKHVQDAAFIFGEEPVKNISTPGGSRRIEGYDISNISGTLAVGSMVVFESNRADKNQYRKFKIKTVSGSDDTAMLAEVLERRFRHDWKTPDLILVDGGMGQVGTARKVLLRIGKRIPILGLAKGPERKNNEVIGEVPEWTDLKTLIRVRDEAHRFAISYHRRLREKTFLV